MEEIVELKEIIMRKFLAFSLVSLATLLMGFSLVAAFAGGPDMVTINGLAYWSSPPTGPDFSGNSLSPFRAQNPTLDVWVETQRENERFLDPDGLPENIQVSRSGTFTYASNPLNDFSEVMLAINPTDSNHLLGSSKFFYDPPTYSFYTGVFESFDAGQTWSQLQPAGVETYSLTSDPVNTFDELGNGYFTLLTRGPTGLDMLKKPPGMPWELPVVVNRTTLTDKQWIIGDQDPQNISPHAGNLYMSWTSFSAPSGIVFARSTDRNQTWSSVLPLASGSVQGSVPGTAPDGTVYVLFGRNIFSTGSGTLELVTSTNGGMSFSSPSMAANISPIPFYLPNSTFRSPASLPAFAVSPANGDLYIAWADYRNGDADIYFSASNDGGVTWTPHVRLNDDPLMNGIDQWQPQISVAPNGRVAVMWFDRRLDCPNLPWIPPGNVGRSNFCIDTFLTRSYDGGQIWEANIRASAQTWDWTLNLPITGGNDGFIGDYQGIASGPDVDYPFWNATANLGENPQNYQQVFVAAIPAQAPPPPPDLKASTKVVTPTIATAGDLLTYTVALQNNVAVTASVQLTDSMPVLTTYVPDSLSASAGTAIYSPTLDAVLWNGTVLTRPVTITFNVTIGQAISGTEIINTAIFNDSVILYERSATTLVLAMDISRFIYLPILIAD
jgi:uncharacterized repeat protein (TIGR01451 family)